MRLATLFLFFGLLTASAVSAGVYAAPDLPTNILHANESSIETLERLHAHAEAQIINNDFDGAIRTYSDILLIEPDDETAYTGLGHCYLVLGQFKKANDAYRHALSINPENESAILGIQKIMDPDGLEGMVHPLQVEAEGDDASLVSELQAPAVRQTQPERAATPPTQPKPATPAPLPVQERMSRLTVEKAEPPAWLTPKPEPAATLVKPVKAEPIAKPLPMPAAIQTTPAKTASVKPATPKTKPVKTTSPKTTTTSPAVAATDSVDARLIQKALRNTGFYSGPIDGVLGPVSRRAIKEYQALHELAPDGVVGPKTWASLRLYLDPND